MWYWSKAILFWQLSIDHIVNVQYKRCGFAKTRLKHPSFPFDSRPYLIRTICRRVHSVNHVTTKRKEVDRILWVWSSVPRARRASGSPAKTVMSSWCSPHKRTLLCITVSAKFPEDFINKLLYNECQFKKNFRLLVCFMTSKWDLSI